LLGSRVLYTVTVESTFTASHQLRMADGAKEPLHSHDWVVRVAVSAENLDETGLAVDFNDLKAMIADVAEPFAGARLEQLDCFANCNASAENVARYIYDRIEPMLANRLKLEYAEVMEATGCWTKYHI